MNNITQTATHSAAYRAGARIRHMAVRTRNTLMIAAAGGAGVASAQTDPLADLNAKATAGTGSIIATVGAIAAVALGVALIIWGVRHLKPKN